MIRTGAVLAAVKNKQGGTRERERSLDEFDEFLKQEHTQISTTDICENTPARLSFRKLPKQEWIIGFLFYCGAAFIYFAMFHWNWSKGQ